MSAYSSYLGSKKCCNTSGAQGPQGPRGPGGPIGPPGISLIIEGGGTGSILVTNPSTNKVYYNDVLEVTNNETVQVRGNIIHMNAWSHDLESILESIRQNIVIMSNEHKKTYFYLKILSAIDLQEKSISI